MTKPCSRNPFPLPPLCYPVCFPDPTCFPEPSSKLQLWDSAVINLSDPDHSTIDLVPLAAFRVLVLTFSYTVCQIISVNPAIITTSITFLYTTAKVGIVYGGDPGYPVKNDGVTKVQHSWIVFVWQYVCTLIELFTVINLVRQWKAMPNPNLNSDSKSNPNSGWPKLNPVVNPVMNHGRLMTGIFRILARFTFQHPQLVTLCLASNLPNLCLNMSLQPFGLKQYSRFPTLT